MVLSVHIISIRLTLVWHTSNMELAGLQDDDKTTRMVAGFGYQNVAIIGCVSNNRNTVADRYKVVTLHLTILCFWSDVLWNAIAVIHRADDAK